MTQTKWMLHAKKADFNKIAENFGISLVTARIICNRGTEDMESIRHYLHGSIEDFHDPRLLPNMEKVVGMLGRKAAGGKTIRIVDDYDIDGVCSTYLLYRALKRTGARVDYEIPDRIKDRYGINEVIIEAAVSDGIDTILTCDNGTAAVSQIARVKRLGMTVIAADHHDMLVEEDEEDLPEGGREVLPPADAIVNPRLRGYAYPSTGIRDGMVAFKLVQMLFEESGVSAQEWLDILEIVVIAAVGGVMKLQGGKPYHCKGGPALSGPCLQFGAEETDRKE